MKMLKLTVVLAIAMLLGSTATAIAESGHGMITLPGASAVQWKPAPSALPKGAEISILMGDPDKPGPFVLRLKMPAGMVIAPHTHATPETVTLLSGSLTHDMGEKRVESRGETMETGGFVYLPADMPHSLWTKSEPALIQVNGTGPFGLKYVDPADDPSKQAR